MAVISGEVGMRKPEERIFRLAADQLGLAPAECVFVDDVEGNITAARRSASRSCTIRIPIPTRVQLSSCWSLAKTSHGKPAYPRPSTPPQRT